jgi:hypothetical protein
MTARSLSSISFGFTKEGFIPRETIYNVHYNEAIQSIFVACGHEGVDVYDVSTGTVRYVTNINAAVLFFEDGIVNIVDIDSDNTLQFLYILDFERGLMAVNI